MEFVKVVIHIKYHWSFQNSQNSRTWFWIRFCRFILSSSSPCKYLSLVDILGVGVQEILNYNVWRRLLEPNRVFLISNIIGHHKIKIKKIFRITRSLDFAISSLLLRWGYLSYHLVSVYTLKNFEMILMYIKGGSNLVSLYF